MTQAIFNQWLLDALKNDDVRDALRDATDEPSGVILDEDEPEDSDELLRMAVEWATDQYATVMIGNDHPNLIRYKSTGGPDAYVWTSDQRVYDCLSIRMEHPVVYDPRDDYNATKQFVDQVLEDTDRQELVEKLIGNYRANDRFKITVDPLAANGLATGAETALQAIADFLARYAHLAPQDSTVARLVEVFDELDQRCFTVPQGSGAEPLTQPDPGATIADRTDQA